MLMMTGRERPAVIEALAPGYGRLFERTLAVLAADERVRAVWLSGSVARGEADAGSDLDFIVTVSDDEHASFAAEWQTWLAAITDTVLAKPLGFAPGSFYSVTPDWHRLDVIVERAGDVGHSMFRTRQAVLDRDGLASLVPAEEPAPAPSAEKVGALVEEFLRSYGLLPVVVARGDWLAGLEGLHLLRTTLYWLFVEASAPHRVTGAKRMSEKLSVEHRRVLEGLPTGEATREGVIEGHLALVGAFREHIPAVCERLGAPWPHRFERATYAHVERQLEELGS
jgi:predicted nucleotidyltransferase